jgi:hypothetical protein
MKLDARTWHTVNVWRLPSGEPCVRPGLRRLYTPEAGRELVGGFSVHNSYVDEVWHYVFDVADSGSLDLRLRILDGEMETFQVFPIASDMRPRIITHAVVEGQILICSPDFPTIFGLVGSGVRFADAVASTNPATTAIPVPRGICTQWANRVVVALGRSLFISDPVAATGGDVRTFVAQNQNQRPGLIFGLHEGAGGSLVAVTSEGVYALPQDAAAVGIVGSNGTGWSFLSHTPAFSYGSSCAHRGRVFGLTREGFAAIDTETLAERRLSEPMMPRAYGTRISLEDYRTCRMLALEEGPAVVAPAHGAIFRTDLTREVFSWWTRDDLDALDVLRTLDGSDLLLCADGIYTMAGDFDGGVALADSDPVRAVVLGQVPHDPERSWQVRHIEAAVAVGGADSMAGIAVRGVARAGSPEPTTEGFIIGISDWGDDLRPVTTPLQSVRASFGAADVPRTEDIAIELALEGCGNRFSPALSLDATADERPGFQLGELA